MLCSCVLLALAASSPLQTPILLSDLNSSSSGVRNGNPERLAEYAGSLWLTAENDPWRYDPATGSAFQLANSFKTSGIAVPAGSGRFVQRLRETSGVNSLIASDGTPAGSQVILAPGLNQLRSDPFEWAGGTYFFTSLNSSVTELWGTDGTAAGTVFVMAFVNGIGFPTEVDFAVVGTQLLVSNLSPSRLLVLSGPAASPVEIGLGGNFSADLAHGLALGSRYCFPAFSPAAGAEPWITDGTAAGTFQLQDINGVFGSDPEFLAADQNRIWFSAVDEVHGRELYLSTGTPGSTQLVIDLAPGFKQGIPSFGSAANPESLAWILPGGDLLFSGSNDTSFGGIQQNYELWRSDGTGAGTSLVANLNPGLPGALPSSFVEHNGLIYFAATFAQQGREVVRTDGTPQGTFLAFEIFPGAGSSNPRLYSKLGSLWVAANDPVLGRELFRSNGSQAGTTLAYEFAPQTTGNSIELLGFEPVRLGDELLFAANGTGVGTELFATDGTPAGTRLVADLVPGASGSNPSELGVTVGKRAFFVADERVFITDGTLAGTQALSNPGLAPSPRHLVRLQGRVLFSAGSGAGETLWATDGTQAGTLALATLQSNSNGQIDGILDSAELAGVLYFYGRGPSGPQAVWRSDGTPTGTRPYASVPSSGQGEPRGFLRDADQLLFFAAASGPGSFFDLWSLDGTPGGASPLFGVNFGPREAARLGAGHVIVPLNGAFGELWYTDGTAAGTQVLADFLPGFSVSVPESLVPIGDRLYFVAALGAGAGSGWWSTDGTPAGTQPVQSNNPLLLDSFAAHDDLGSLDELVYGAYTFGGGLELWRHEPYSGAQVRLTDIYPGAGDSRPTGSAEINGRLVFDAFSPVSGRELWALDLTANGIPSAEASAPGCGFSAPAPQLEVLGDLRSGGSFELRSSNAAPLAVSLALYSLPSPFIDLGQGCVSTVNLFTAVQFATQVADLGGRATTGFSLPVNPALAGLALSVQAIVVDPGGPLFGVLGTTNGVQVVFAP